jgi:hypothetical protein
VLVVRQGSRQPDVLRRLIITVVYFPILALTGIEGKMFKPMAITVIFALVGALVLALTLMPALCSYLLGGNISEKDSFLVKWAKKVYAPLLNFSLRFRWGRRARRWRCSRWRSCVQPARRGVRAATRRRLVCHAHDSHHEHRH